MTTTFWTVRLHKQVDGIGGTYLANSEEDADELVYIVREAVLEPDDDSYLAMGCDEDREAKDPKWLTREELMAVINTAVAERRRALSCLEARVRRASEGKERPEGPWVVHLDEMLDDLGGTYLVNSKEDAEQLTSLARRAGTCIDNIEDEALAYCEEVRREDPDWGTRQDLVVALASRLTARTRAATALMEEAMGVL